MNQLFAISRYCLIFMGLLTYLSESNGMNDDLDAATKIIQSRAGPGEVEIAIVVGAGLGEAVERLDNEVSIPYEDLPGFPMIKTQGQENRLVIGELEGVRIACLKGRNQYSDTGRSDDMALPLEAMTFLGAGTFLITGTCGSVDADLFPGALVTVTDHINLNGLNPLIGVNNDGGIISLSKTYDERLNARLKRSAAAAGIAMKEGVYMWFSGPTFETPAEIKMARILGATVVGSAGISEMILARRLGVRACRVSAVSHFGAGFHKSDPSQIEARDFARQSAISLRRLIRTFLRTKEGVYAAESKPTSLLRKQPLT